MTDSDQLSSLNEIQKSRKESTASEIVKSLTPISLGLGATYDWATTSEILLFTGIAVALAATILLFFQRGAIQAQFPRLKPYS